MALRSLLVALAVCCALTGIRGEEDGDESVERVSWMVYEHLAVNLTCFRKLNGTGEVGCGSSRQGNVGVLHVIRKESREDDVDWITKKGNSPPYSVGVDSTLVNTTLFEILASSRRVNGILIFNVEGDSSIDSAAYTEDHSSPNFVSGLYKPGEKYFDYPWISHGKSISWRSWDLPIAIVQDESTRDGLVRRCYEKFNEKVSMGSSSGPLCAVEFLSRMYAAKDTPTCLRRTEQTNMFSPSTYEQCYPLQSYNVHTPLVPRDKKTFSYKDRSVTVLAVRLDTTSMYEHVGNAADSVVTSLVSLMAVAGSLKKLAGNFSSTQESVYFMLLNGESYDYIGSSSITRDMADENFPNATSYESDWDAPPPLKISHIKRWIELDQIGVAEPSKLFMHWDPVSEEDPEVKKTIDDMKSKLKESSSLELLDARSTVTGIPPSSAQRILREDPKIAALVLAGYNDRFINKYYHSFKETPKLTLNYTCGASSDGLNMDVVNRLVNISSTVANGVARMILGSSDEITADVKSVSDMLECYLCSSNCSLFYNISIKEYRPRLRNGEPFPLYTSIGSRAGFIYEVILFTRRLLVTLIGTPVEFQQEECKGQAMNDLYFYDWFNFADNRNACIRSTVALHAALSPAFKIPGYDWGSGAYSTWVESFTGFPSLKIFVLPSRAQELVTLFIGIFITALSFAFSLLCVRSRELIYSTAT